MKPSKHQEQSVSCLHQSNYVAAHYRPIAPWFILTFIRPWIIVGCIYNHILFNILLCIQTMLHHKDRLLLATIWSKEIFIAVRRMRREQSQIQNIYSRGGVPQAYLTLKREDCNGCARRNPWNSKRRLYHQGRRLWSRYGGLSKLFRHQIEEEAR